jgi:NADH dehydrogenase
MAASLFITGSNGFIGRKLFQKLDGSQYEQIFCLSRNYKNETGRSRATGNGKIEWIQGEIEDIKSYAPYLSCSDTVVHLAAATGKADRDEYFRVNAQGTMLFLEHCKRAGVKNFLHISTIAVNYPEKSYYYYAQSKELAERAVVESGLNYTIIRPTIVIGDDSAIWKSLSRLARAPIIPLFGGGKTHIQPIYVDDLVECLVEVLNKGIFTNTVFELGGPEKVTFEAFLTGVHRAYYQKSSPTISIPLRPLSRILSGVEERFHRLLPITAGQLSAFRNDSLARPNSLFDQKVANMKGVKEMVDIVIHAENSNKQTRSLNRECSVFTSYLMKREATEYVQEKYREAHTTSRIFDDLSSNPFDSFLLRLSTKSPFMLRLVDAYTAVFAKRSTFRRKMILLLAILESCAPTYRQFEITDAPGAVSLGFRLAERGLFFSLTLLLSLLLLAPARFILAVSVNSLTGVSKLWIKS